jgi:Zn-dependent M28 family amino/carboxypeptidase
MDALINIDMIGRSSVPGNANPANKNLTGPNEIYVIGATVMSSELNRICRAVNDNYLKLTYNYKYDDPKDPEQIFFRSDHFNYAKQGIPILFYFDGVHEDYHRPTDKVDKIDFGKMERVTRTIYQTLWELASLRDRPKVDKPLPPQLRPR